MKNKNWNLMRYADLPKIEKAKRLIENINLKRSLHKALTDPSTSILNLLKNKKETLIYYFDMY